MSTSKKHTPSRKRRPKEAPPGIDAQPRASAASVASTPPQAHRAEDSSAGAPFVHDAAFDAKPLNTSERRAITKYYEEELRAHQVLVQVIDVDKRVIIATHWTSQMLQAREGRDNCYLARGAGEKFTVKFLSLSRFMDTLYRQDSRWNGFRPLSPAQLEQMQAEALAQQERDERARQRAEFQPRLFSEILAEEQDPAQRELMRAEFEAAVERELHRRQQGRRRAQAHQPTPSRARGGVDPRQAREIQRLYRPQAPPAQRPTGQHRRDARKDCRDVGELSDRAIKDTAGQADDVPQADHQVEPQPRSPSPRRSTRIARLSSEKTTPTQLGKRRAEEPLAISSWASKMRALDALGEPPARREHAQRPASRPKHARGRVSTLQQQGHLVKRIEAAKLQVQGTRRALAEHQAHLRALYQQLHEVHQHDSDLEEQ